MSSPELAGDHIKGIPMAARAAALDSPRERSLLYFLQSLSLQRGGRARIVAELLEMFPEHIGTREMHACGIKPGKKFSACEAKRIGFCGEEEIHGGTMKDIYEDREGSDCWEDSADRLIAILKEQALLEMPDFLTELCINPDLKLLLPDEQGPVPYRAGVPYFRDVVLALVEYQRLYAERAKRNFLMTSIAKKVFDVLDYSLANRKTVLLRGNAGIGKTEDARAWCDIHRGESRFVSLNGINNQTAFFRTIAKACGVASSENLTVTKVQARVQDFLDLTHIMLVLEEAQYLWPQQERIYSQPDLVNWLMTACYNRGVPVVLIATKEFDRRRQQVEAQTSWSSEQFSRRWRAFDLPEAPTRQDLEAVARKLEPEATKPMIDYAVGYAMTSKRFFDGVREVFEDAHWLAKRDGITFEDIKRAVKIRVASDASLKRVLPKRQGRRMAPAVVPQECGQAADDPGSADNDFVETVSSPRFRRTAVTEGALSEA